MEDPYGVYRGQGRASGRSQVGASAQLSTAQHPGEVNGSDALRDTCSKMFQRDGWGRGSQTVRPNTQTTMPVNSPRPGVSAPLTSPGAEPSDPDGERGKNGTLTKKYYHIKDMISNRFGKLGSEPNTRSGGVNGTSGGAPNNSTNGDASAATNGTSNGGRSSKINSSFRKAMQRSSQKSNLNDDSAQMYGMTTMAGNGDPRNDPRSVVDPRNDPRNDPRGYTPASVSAGSTHYGYTGGYAAGGQGRLGPPPQHHPPVPQQHQTNGYGHSQYGTVPVFPPVSQHEYSSQQPMPSYATSASYPTPASYAHSAAYGTTVASTAAPWQQQRPLPPQPYPGSPPQVRPGLYGVTQQRAPLPPQQRPAAPPAYGTHQPHGPPGPPGAAGFQRNGSQGRLYPDSICGQTSRAGPTGPPPQRPPPPPSTAPPADDGDGGASAATAAADGNRIAGNGEAASPVKARTDPPYTSRQELQRQKVELQPQQQLLQPAVEGPFSQSSDSGNGSSQSTGADGAPKVTSPAPLDSSLDSDAQTSRQQKTSLQQQGGHSSGNDSEWVDMVETELRQILDPRMFRSGGTSTSNTAPAGSSTPPLPALPLGDSPRDSPATSPKNESKLSLSYSASALNQPDLIETMPAETQSVGVKAGPGGSAVRRSGSNSQSRGWSSRKTKESPARADQRFRQRVPVNTRLASVSSAGRTDGDGGDVTSMTTGLDLESMLDQTTDQTTDDESTVLDASADGPAIRKQLESLETMYSEVLRLLGGPRRGQPGARLPRGSAGLGKHRMYGSLSSLPSSIGGRPSKERRRDDRKKLKDMKGISKRFQRLESHVVTLARSVAHLSSEMRTQHLMFQEMESIRAELTQLRTSPGRALRPRPSNDWEAFRDAVPSLTHPARVRKLTKFFGDEPPLLRIFLKKLGYEKYAQLFERERIGMIELPYMTEERLQKLGIPIGPRLRILQEAQMSLRNDNFNVYIL